MQSLDIDGFTPEQIKAALHLTGGQRKTSFRYELLDQDDNIKKDLNTVLSVSIEHGTFRQVKRTAKFTLKEDSDINYLSDKIKPYMRLYVPDGRILARYYAFMQASQPALYETIKESGNSGWAEFPLGVFYLSSPTRQTSGKTVTREIDAYDGLIVLLQDKFVDRYTVTAGTKYYDAVIAILNSAGITKYNLEYSDLTLDRDIEFEIGKEKLFAVNELLGMINYTPLHVDTNGYYQSFTYRSPSQRSAEYTYATDDTSITFPDMEEELDLFEVPNKWVVVRTNSDLPPLVSTYTNDNPDSPTSTVSMGRTIVQKFEVENIANQTTLDAYVQRRAEQASQVYGYVTFDTAINPLHDYQDVLEIDFSELGIKTKYAEMEWSFDCQAGGRMKHQVRRVVRI